MKTGTLALVGLLTGLTLAATGCTSMETTQQAIDGPMYPAGYADGCASAREADRAFSTKVIQDETLFKNDRSYRTGWRQGFSSCKTEQIDSPDRAGNGFEPF
ncbi:hypothetical protein FF098_016720 [Parvularcula flava]|uniref:Lipoprotein n=2 Tax=Aquisalinus luteolus TaxID=1566827 RepID=A0ABX0HND6_9PROT|nr:hypothetical protein [Aquisalinus luteolus]NHK29553.1 hypothetical protein [Aquisalinus luteolus]